METDVEAFKSDFQQAMAARSPRAQAKVPATESPRYWGLPAVESPTVPEGQAFVVAGIAFVAPGMVERMRREQRARRLLSRYGPGQRELERDRRRRRRGPAPRASSLPRP